MRLDKAAVATMLETRGPCRIAFVQTIARKVMADRPFKKPVYLSLNSTGNFQARSAWEALEYLDRYWTGSHSPHYRRAKVLCQQAVDGFIPPDTARRALIDAAQRAGLLERGWRHNPDASRSVFRPVLDVAAQRQPSTVSFDGAPSRDDLRHA
jgi:hypothetical protein